MSRLASSAWIFLALLLSPVAAAQSYRVTDLGALSAGDYTAGYAINASGEVAGQNGPYPQSGFIWSASHGMKALSPISGNNFSWALGINAKGVASGQSILVENGHTHFHAVIWFNGQIQDLGALYTGGTSIAHAINDADQVIGASTIPGGKYHAILWSKTTGMLDLGVPSTADEAVALSINRYGKVVGTAYATTVTQFAFVWTKSTGMQNLGPLLGGGLTSANAVNDLGQIVGESGCGSGCLHAALWSPNAKIQDLGLLSGSDGGAAFGINNHGQAVGVAYYTSGFYHAFVWSQSAGIQDLNSLIPAGSGWLLVYAIAINDNGQITGQGTINGETHAFLLTPIATTSEFQP